MYAIQIECKNWETDYRSKREAFKVIAVLTKRTYIASNTSTAIVQLDNIIADSIFISVYCFNIATQLYLLFAKTCNNILFRYSKNQIKFYIQQLMSKTLNIIVVKSEKKNRVVKSIRRSVLIYLYI